MSRVGVEKTVEQLPGADAIFLSLENETTSGHIGGLSILDPTGADGFSIDRLVRELEERVGYEPRFSMRVRTVPLGLDRPYLEHDPGFRFADHVHRVAVPQPGTMRELAALMGYLHGQKLDLRRPLWEAWIIEGLEHGRVGLYLKIHHALMDGESGQALTRIMADPEPEPKQPFGERYEALRPVRPAPTRISDLEVGLRTARHLVDAPGRLATMVGNLVKTTAVSRLREWLEIESPPISAPRLSFNDCLGARRGFASSRVALADVKRVKDHFNTTVNDVVLAITGDALRGYLLERGELPESSLVAMIPISTRAEGDASLGNQITSAPCSWATDIEDPVERLLAIHRNADRTKAFARQYDSDILGNIGEAMPPILAKAFLDAASSAMPVIGNATVSNVRGTPFPLYSAGARIEAMYPLSLLTDTQGLNITVVSYCGQLDFGLTVDPSLVPDAWGLAARIPAALETLVKATGHVAAQDAPTDRSRAGVDYLQPVEPPPAADVA